jgi:hypothetical protein
VKNIQVIDGAMNSSFSIYSVAERDFSLIFPMIGQDVEFVEDIVERLGYLSAGELVQRVTSVRVEKKDAKGIQGTLFFDLFERRQLYPNKRESDFDKPDPSAHLNMKRARVSQTKKIKGGRRKCAGQRNHNRNKRDKSPEARGAGKPFA